MSQKLFFKYKGILPLYSELGIATYINWESHIANTGLQLHIYEEIYVLSRFGSQLKELITSPNATLKDFSPIFERRLKCIIDKINSDINSVDYGILSGQIEQTNLFHNKESTRIQREFVSHLDTVFSTILDSNCLTVATEPYDDATLRVNLRTTPSA